MCKAGALAPAFYMYSDTADKMDFMYSDTVYKHGIKRDDNLGRRPRNSINACDRGSS